MRRESRRHPRGGAVTATFRSPSRPGCPPHGRGPALAPRSPKHMAARRKGRQHEPGTWGSAGPCEVGRARRYRRKARDPPRLRVSSTHRGHTRQPSSLRTNRKRADILPRIGTASPNFEKGSCRSAGEVRGIVDLTIAIKAHPLIKQKIKNHNQNRLSCGTTFFLSPCPLSSILHAMEL